MLTRADSEVLGIPSLVEKPLSSIPDVPTGPGKVIDTQTLYKNESNFASG